MPTTRTISASEFKAKCLDILDQVADREVESVTITKRGRTVGVLVPPRTPAIPVEDLYGFMEGTVFVPDDVDLTEPVLDEPLGAASGKLHR